MADDKSITSVGNTARFKIGGKTYNDTELSGMRTGSELRKAEEARATEGLTRGGFTAPHVVKNAEIKSRASFYEAAERTEGGKNSGGEEAARVPQTWETQATREPIQNRTVQEQTHTQSERVSAQPVMEGQVGFGEKRGAKEEPFRPKDSLQPSPSQYKPHESIQSREEQPRVKTKEGSVPNVVASREPVPGISLGAVYGSSIELRRNSSVARFPVETGSRIEKAAEARAERAAAQGSYTPTRIIGNPKIESRASFYEAMGRFERGPASLPQGKVAMGADRQMVGKGLKAVFPASPQVNGASPLAKLPVASAPAQGALVAEEKATSSGEPVVVSVMAGKPPAQGLTLGSSYFIARAMWRNAPASTATDTAVWDNRGAQARTQQSIAKNVQSAMGGPKISDIPKNVWLEGKASFFEAMGHYQKGKVSLTQNAKDALSAGGNMLVGRTQGEFASHDDMGSQEGAGLVAAGTAAYTGFKLAQKASPIVINVVKTLPSNVSRAGQSVVRVGRGVWDVTTTVGRATVTVVRTARIVHSAFIPLNAQLIKNVFVGQAYMSGLSTTATSQRILSGVRQIQSRVSQIRTGMARATGTVKTGFVAARDGMKRSYNLVRGMVNGTVRTSEVAHRVLLNAQKGLGKAVTAASKAGVKGLNVVGKGVARGAVKGAVWTVKRGIPGAVRGAGNLSLGIGGAMASSDDMMVSGIGNSITIANYGVKTAKATVKVTGYAVKTSAKGAVKTVKGTYHAVKFIRDKGLRAAWTRARQKTATAIANAGKSVISAVANVLKAAGQKVIVPILIIVVCATVIISMFSAPIAAVGSIFSGLFSIFGGGDDGNEVYTETDIRKFVTDPAKGVPALRADYINDLYAYMQDQLDTNGGGYDYVRFKTNTEDNLIEPSVVGISSVFYTEEELANIIQPIFNALILKEYELEPTEAQAEQALKDIFDKLFRLDDATTTEWCGQAAEDGSGAVTTHDCGEVHALGDCTNSITGTHSSYTCSACCLYYYICDGHSYRSCGKAKHTHDSSCESLSCGRIAHTHNSSCYENGNLDRLVCGSDVHTHNSSCYSYSCGKSEHSHSDSCYSISYHHGEMTSACSNCTKNFRCTGYAYCGSHKILTVTLNMDGLYELLNAYFEEPIDALANRADRTDEEEEELSNLKDSYAICLEYISEVAKQYGGGLTMEDLAGIQWVNGSRTGNQSIIDIALTQVGQVGGQPYWSWYGFESRVEWCACFVSWCMNQAGYSEVKYSSCQWGGLPYFQDNGQWANRGFTDLAAGDVIFFDWENDGRTDHTGLVIGRDEEYIYTVEGNMGDSVRVRQYEINSGVISGFGLMKAA